MAGAILVLHASVGVDHEPPEAVRIVGVGAQEEDAVTTGVQVAGRF